MTFQAFSIGPAVAAFCGEGRRGGGRVHTVFDSTVNIEVEGCDLLLAIAGPSGAILPHVIAIKEEAAFRSWNLDPGSPVCIGGSQIVLGIESSCIVNYGGATVRSPLALPRIELAGEGWRGCVKSLARIQELSGSELRLGLVEGMEAMGREGNSATAGYGRLGVNVAAAVSALGNAVSALESSYSVGGAAVEAVGRAALSLIGAGQGLTPSGDDFLCGFLAATRCAARGGADGELLRALRLAIEGGLGRTNGISASLLRCALRGFFPLPLVSIARSLAVSDLESATGRLDSLCSLGQTSGADMATGFLYGIGLLCEAAYKKPLLRADARARPTTAIPPDANPPPGHRIPPG